MVVSTFRSSLVAMLALGLSLSSVFAQDDAPRPRVKMTTSLGAVSYTHLTLPTTPYV